MTSAGGGSVLITARTLSELKAEIQRRADNGIPPLLHIKPDDVRTALAGLDTLDRDAWASAFMRIADRAADRAAELEASAPDRAREHYWYAWRLYHFARWPVENSPNKKQAKQRALESFRAYARLLDPRIEIVRIPFEGSEIVGYLRVPVSSEPVPLVFAISGLDSRKEDIAAVSDDYLRRGLAMFAVDMPGTGEAPIRIALGAERMFSCALDYLVQRSDIAADRIVVQGRSWSGYWAARLAYAERERIRGAVMHGGPIHGYFQPDWQRTSSQTLEYLYDLVPATASAYGVTSFEDILDYGPPLSLKTIGLLDQPSAPMLLVNGVKDSQIPIADVLLLLQHGDAKDAWVNPVGGHMGRSPEWPSRRIFDEVLMPWMLRHLTPRSA
jgi:dienelactone hydrolase